MEDLKKEEINEESILNDDVSLVQKTTLLVVGFVSGLSILIILGLYGYILFII